MQTAIVSLGSSATKVGWKNWRNFLIEQWELPIMAGGEILSNYFAQSLEHNEPL